MCKGTRTYNLGSLPQIAEGVMSDDRDLQLEAIRTLKSWLTQPNPPVDDIVQTGVVPQLVQVFYMDNFPDKFEAAFVLAYMTLSEDTHVLIENDILPLFLQLLGSDREEERLLVVWALGNIAESSQGRDHVFNSGAMTSLLSQFNDRSSCEMIRVAAETIFNLCKGDPHPEQTNAVLPVLGKLLSSNNSDGVYVSALKALFYLSNEGDNETIQRVTALGVIHVLIEFLSHWWMVIQYAALRIIHNIVLAPDVQYLQLVINNQLFPSLSILLGNTEEIDIKKEICQIVLYITRVDKLGVIQSGIMEDIIPLLQNHNYRIRKYALQVVCKATHQCGYHELRILVEQGCIQPLCNLIAFPVRIIVLMALKALQNILDVEKAENDARGVDFLYRRMVIEVGGLDHIENLILSDLDDDIIQRASDFVVDYFPEPP